MLSQSIPKWRLYVLHLSKPEVRPYKPLHGAPDGTRTHTVTILSRLPLPLGYGGRNHQSLVLGSGGPGFKG